MAFKMRPAIQENVGMPVTELDDEATKMLDESSKKVEPVTEKPAPAKIDKKTASAATSVNLRRDPSLTAPIVCVLYPGENVKVQYYDAEWYKLNYKGVDCYVRKEYMNVKGSK